MRAAVASTTALLLLGAALVMAAPAPLSVRFLSPGADAVFGEITIAVALAGAEAKNVERVEIKLDGRVVRTLTAAPFSTKLNVGDNNVEHVFEATARTSTGATATARVQTPRLQIDEEYNLDLQQLFVTVARDGNRVLGLDRGDFRVEEDGHRQEIVTFERGDVPLTAVLLIDSSQSMTGGRLEAAVRGARAFVAGMKDLDEASMMLFSDRLLRSTPFSDRAETVGNALQGIEAAGGTAVNDHLYLALKLLDGRLGRRVIILFSDGADVLSALSMEQVLWKARRSPAQIYWIRLEDERGPRTSFTSTWRNNLQNHIEFTNLEAAIKETGGRIQTLNSVNEIESAFGGVLRELREQYVIGYYSSQDKDDGGWRKVNVDVRGSYAVRAREGYVDN